MKAPSSGQFWESRLRNNLPLSDRGRVHTKKYFVVVITHYDVYLP